MKNLKSRTMVGRTIARVKSRITSFGSIAPQINSSPNPLITPPPLPMQPRVDGPHDEPHAHSPTSYSKKKNVTEATNDGFLPRIATLTIMLSTWTLFSNPLYPRYAATAYVQFTITCEPRNAAHSPASQPSSVSTIRSPKTCSPLKPEAAALLANPPGLLLNLTLNLTISGPHTVLQSFGDVDIPCLGPDGQWVYLLHLGIKDTSLASKLSTSWRTVRKKASRSLKRYNMETIDRWLDVLTAESRNEITREEVVVKATVRYQHSFLPHSDRGTWLEDVGECKVNMSKTGAQSARTSCQLGVDGMFEMDRKLSGDEELDSMMEEMVREHNVALGPPFML